MAAVCIVNLEDIRTLAREQGERLPSLAQREWLERAIMRHVVGTRDCLKATCPSRVELSSVHVARAIAGGEPTVRFLPSATLLKDVALVVDWLARLQERDPRLARKLRRVTFADALEMSRRWHRQLQEAAVRKQERAIPVDPVGAPRVLDAPSLGPRWSWVWLKSPGARQAEGEAMGHCVGSGGYESGDPGESVLSLRDPDGVPHVTLHLEEVRIRQAVSKGNGKVSARYQTAVDRASAIIGVRLFVGGNPERAISDGCHRRNGCLIHVRHGLLHRDDGPAVERADGTKCWFLNGKLHRDDAPAVEQADGARWWYRDGKLHREGGPAVERANGTAKWFRDGRCHREGGPAIVYASGGEEWYCDGWPHREDGPAFEGSTGTTMWFRHGRRHREDGPAVEEADGTRKWYCDGNLHREDGPAVELPDGTRVWFRHGHYHRNGGPAVEGADGTREWYRDGNLHRDDGPAIEWVDGGREWHLDGTQVSEQDLKPQA